MDKQPYYRPRQTNGQFRNAVGSQLNVGYRPMGAFHHGHMPRPPTFREQFRPQYSHTPDNKQGIFSPPRVYHHSSKYGEFTPPRPFQGAHDGGGRQCIGNKGKQWKYQRSGPKVSL